jgi:lipoprotein NlpI
MNWFWNSLLALAVSAPAPAQSPAQELVEAGMRLFVEGKIAASIEKFDEAAKQDERLEPHLWQRGIAYYYVGRFEDGRKQFETHRKVNPNDVENTAWWYLCMAKLGRRQEAQRQLLPAGPDERVPMKQVYDLYAGKGAERAVLDAVNEGSPGDRERAARLFYAHLYLGLFAEAAGDRRKAQRHIREAVNTHAGGYMWEVARIHLRSGQKVN